MTYLAHTAHVQLCGLALSCVGWTLIIVALGTIEWRVWLVSDREVISSGVAWVGVWKTCFHSYTLVTPGLKFMHCSYISLTEAFTPPEMAAAQVLLLLSLVVGLCGNAGGVYALRNAYFGIDRNLKIFFVTAGTLCLLAAVISLVPLVWNMNSVLTNQTISFPPEFQMPPAPESQHVGCGIGFGMAGTVLLIISGIIFCMYRLPVRSKGKIRHNHQHEAQGESGLTGFKGEDNPAFEPFERL